MFHRRTIFSLRLDTMTWHYKHRVSEIEILVCLQNGFWISLKYMQKSILRNTKFFININLILRFPSFRFFSGMGLQHSAYRVSSAWPATGDSGQRALTHSDASMHFSAPVVYLIQKCLFL